MNRPNICNNFYTIICVAHSLFGSLSGYRWYYFKKCPSLPFKNISIVYCLTKKNDLDTEFLKSMTKIKLGVVRCYSSDFLTICWLEFHWFYIICNVIEGFNLFWYSCVKVSPKLTSAAINTLNQLPDAQLWKSYEKSILGEYLMFLSKL